jgi:hypothetical protein
MGTKDILILVLVITALGFSIYKKYNKKSRPGEPVSDKNDSSRGLLSSKDDDYEPYSKK